MSKNSMVLRDLIASVISGDTINVNTSTATDLIRVVTAEGTIDTPWSQTAYTYNISGYTIAQSVEGATLYPFYVNTGATLTTLTSGLTGDTLLSTYISGSTIVPSGVTVTEVMVVTTGITSEVNNALKVNLGSNATVSNLFVSGNLTVSGATIETEQYVTDELIIGAVGSQLSWRFIHDPASDNLLVQIYSGATWVTKSQFTA